MVAVRAREVDARVEPPGGAIVAVDLLTRCAATAILAALLVAVPARVVADLGIRCDER